MNRKLTRLIVLCLSCAACFHEAQANDEAQRVNDMVKYLQNLSKKLQSQAQLLSESKSLRDGEALKNHVQKEAKIESAKRVRREDAEKALEAPLLQSFAVQPPELQAASGDGKDTNAVTAEYLNGLREKLDAYVRSASSEANALAQDINRMSNETGSAAQNARDQLDALVGNYAVTIAKQADEVMQNAQDAAGSLAENVGPYLDGAGSDVRAVADSLTDWYGDVHSSVSSFVGDAQDESDRLRQDLNAAIRSAGSKAQMWSSRAQSDLSDWLNDANDAASRFEASLGSDAIDSLSSKISDAMSDAFSSASDLADTVKSAANDLAKRLRTEADNEPSIPSSDFVPALSGAMTFHRDWSGMQYVGIVLLSMWIGL